MRATFSNASDTVRLHSIWANKCRLKHGKALCCISMAGGKGNLLKSISGIPLMTLIVNYLYLRHTSAWNVDLTREIVLFAATFLDARIRSTLRTCFRIATT